MTVTRRWLDGGHASPEILELLKAARPPSALDPATRARSRRRLAASTALPVVTFGMTYWLKSVALGAVLGSAATVALVVPEWGEALRNRTKAPGATAVASSRPTGTRASAASAVPVAIESDGGIEAAAQAPSSPTITVSGRKTAPSASGALDDDLGREIQLLERARQLLAVDPARALHTLHEHEREFGRGTLGLEREFLEVEALLRLGKRDAASQHAAALRARAPGSLYERRLKQLVPDEND